MPTGLAQGKRDTYVSGPPIRPLPFNPSLLQASPAAVLSRSPEIFGGTAPALLIYVSHGAAGRDKCRDVRPLGW